MKKTPISELGEFALIDKISSNFKNAQKSTIEGIGDDCAVIDAGDHYKLISTDQLLEGIHFNLMYSPLKHLGAKSVVAGISDVLAMNGTPTQILVSIGVSARFYIEDIEEFYQGVKEACDIYNVDLVGGDTSASLTGFTINITAIGEVKKENIVYRSGAKPTDLICISGDLGAAYMGLQVLERERRIFESTQSEKQPQLDAYPYIIQKQLLPKARKDIIETFNVEGVKPTSMIDISDGLASEIKHICKRSKVGARIYLDKIPISSHTFDICKEMNLDAVTAALNGGDDYEILFTIPLNKYEEIKGLTGFEVIGHITEESKGCYLTTPEGEEVEVRAQGWK